MSSTKPAPLYPDTAGCITNVCLRLFTHFTLCHFTSLQEKLTLYCICHSLCLEKIIKCQYFTVFTICNHLHTIRSIFSFPIIMFNIGVLTSSLPHVLSSTILTLLIVLLLLEAVHTNYTVLECPGTFYRNIRETYTAWPCATVPVIHIKIF